MTTWKSLLPLCNEERLACSLWVWGTEKARRSVEGSWLTGGGSLLEPISQAQHPKQFTHKDKISVV